MSATKTKASRSGRRVSEIAGTTALRQAPRDRSGSRTLEIDSGDPLRIDRLIRRGLSSRHLNRLKKKTDLPWEKLARFVSIPLTTLTRRQKEGKLTCEESDRVWRASKIFDLAVELFEGDLVGARRWLQTPQPGLGGEVPFELAATQVGAREVENLILRLEYGAVA